MKIDRDGSWIDTETPIGTAKFKRDGKLKEVAVFITGEFWREIEVNDSHTGKGFATTAAGARKLIRLLALAVDRLEYEEQHIVALDKARAAKVKAAPAKARARR